ncbi:MAG TPA: DUF1573 domain-containing protein [Chitinispirillaceae bacterium]|nr:DUF1573 domain-containing protein [Chitinispirillaceae bacterium]
MLKFIQSSSIAIILSTYSIFAGPKMEIESKTINCGDIIEGTATKVPAVFTVKNTGDAPLKLTTVKPSCGCTVVKFDSTIQAGKSTKIESAVNIPGYRSGHYTKQITVKSNVDDSTTRLAIEFTILPAIEISDHAVDFDSSTINNGKIITLSTKKVDLKVTSVQYTADTTAIPMKFNLIKTDSLTASGLHVFKLALFNPPKAKKGVGRIRIALNHENKSEISITGNVHIE